MAQPSFGVDRVQFGRSDLRVNWGSSFAAGTLEIFADLVGRKPKPAAFIDTETILVFTQD